MQDLSLEYYFGVIDKALEVLKFGQPLGEGFILLANIVVIFYFGRIAITNLLKAGEGFSFEQLKTPIFYILLVNGWVVLNDFITDFINYITFYINDVGGGNLANVTSDYLNSLDGLVDKNEQALRDKKNLDLEEANLKEEVLIELSTIDDFFIVKITRLMFSAVMQVDKLLYVIFYMVSLIWKFLLGFGAPIALVVSLFSGGFTVLINWAKNYLAVCLWVPVAALIMKLVNVIMSSVVTQYINGFTVSYDDVVFLQYSKVLNSLVLMTVLFILIIAIKIILLAKTPQIITSWIGGGSSSGGGFAGAFVAINTVKNVGKAAATGGKSLAGSVGSKLKKNG